MAVKDIAARVRPALVPVADTLGPSFPSGHSSTSASFYAAAALILGRRAQRPTRQLLAAVAISVSVAVAASRVPLDVHWLTDVIGGLTPRLGLVRPLRGSLRRTPTPPNRSHRHRPLQRNHANSEAPMTANRYGFCASW